MELERFIEVHLPYAYAVGNRVGRTLDRDERDSVVHLALAEAAWAWVRKPATERGEFKFYLARIVERLVREASTKSRRQTSRNPKDGQIARLMVEFADVRQKRAEALEQGELAELAEVVRAKGIPVSLDRLRATQVGFADTEQSLDCPIYDGEATYADTITDRLAWRLDPEELLIAKEEREGKKADRTPSLDRQRQLLASWIGWLPKRQRQVWSWHLQTGRWYRPPFRHLCSRKYGGTHGTGGGLAITPEEAACRYDGGMVMLRAFARGDFTQASFEEVVRRVPTPLIERFITTLDDPLAQYVVKMRLLTTYKSKVDKGDGRVYCSKLRPTLSTVARVWRQRLSQRVGRELTREESVELVRIAFERACRQLAVTVGIAPPDVLKKF